MKAKKHAVLTYKGRGVWEVSRRFPTSKKAMDFMNMLKRSRTVLPGEVKIVEMED